MSVCTTETTPSQISNYEWDAAKAAEIIKSEINDDLFKIVKNTDNFLKIWKRLEMICTQVEQSVIYAELHFLLLYFFTVKVLEHEKFINMCVKKITSMVKKIKAAVTIEQDVWNNIALIILLESLSKKYDARKNHILNQTKTTMTVA